MSAANAALSVSSVIALPPYLTTTILPCSCLSHGSASASTCALTGGARAVMSCRPSSLRRSRATGRWSGSTHARRRRPRSMVTSMSVPDRSTSRAPGAPTPSTHTGEPLNDTRDPVGIEGDRRHADRGEHPAPVGVGAEQRGLDQAVAGDQPGGGQRVGLDGRAGDGDRDALGDALGVGLQLGAQVVAHPQHGVVEFALAGRDLAGARGEQQHGVVGGAAAVDVEPVEGQRGRRGAAPVERVRRRRRHRW